MVIGLIAAAFFVFSTLGLGTDLAYRCFGNVTYGRPVQELGYGKTRRTVIQYYIYGKPYYMFSPRLQRSGYVETLRYFPGDPPTVRSDLTLPVDVVAFLAALLFGFAANMMYSAEKIFPRKRPAPEGYR